MATAAHIRAYLDWQSEMGTDEVILPHPLVKKQASGAAATLPGTGVAAPRETQRQPSSGIPPAAPHQARTASHAEAGPVAASTDLFQSLVQSLESAGDARRDSLQLPGAPKSAPLRPAEAVNLPDFDGLEAFRLHLEKNPGLLLGEAPAPVSGRESAARAGAGENGTVTRMIRGCGPVGAPLALVGFGPSEADIAEGLAFRGEAGALLEKMMRAIRLETGELYLTHLIKAHVPGKIWSRRELTRLLPILHAELGLAQAPMVLILGQECAQTVLKTGKTLEELRQETHRMEGREFFVSYHPQELLRKEELKRKAWEDLQWLQRRMAEAQARP